jgi:hypothetical protein
MDSVAANARIAAELGKSMHRRKLRHFRPYALELLEKLADSRGGSCPRLPAGGDEPRPYIHEIATLSEEGARGD